MKALTHKTALFFYFLYCSNLVGISIVYNFRIAQITKQQIFSSSSNEHKHSIIALMFDQYRKKYNGTLINYLGGLSSYIYNWDSYYFRTDFAVSQIQEYCNNITTYSGPQADDILFTFGKNVKINDKTDITYSGLFGIPTHKVSRLLHPDFGYSQIGTGMQLDGSYSFDERYSIIFGTRFIYFVPRDARDSDCNQYTFTLGDVADFLGAFKSNWGQYGLEFGYSRRFRFGAQIYPNLDDIVEKTNYIRNNFYMVYKYKFMINNVANRFLLNISYAYDSSPKNYGNKYVATIWTSWNIRF